MKKSNLFRLIFVFVLLNLVSCERLDTLIPNIPDAEKSPGSSQAITTPVYDHIFVVWFENMDRDDVWLRSSAPYMNSIIQSGTLFKYFYCYTNSYSQPNYVAAFSGSRYGITTNSVLSGRPLTNPNLYTALAAKGKTFQTYCEDMPYAGYTGKEYNRYRRRHNAPINFSNVPGSVIKPFPLSTNYNSYSTVTWIIPNNDSNGHDQSLSYADNWLKTKLKPIVDYCKIPANNSLFILYFDEGSGSDRKIATTFVGNRVKVNHVVSTTYDIGHYSLLRTVLDMYGCSQLGATTGYVSMTGWYN